MASGACRRIGDCCHLLQISCPKLNHAQFFSGQIFLLKLGQPSATFMVVVHGYPQRLIR
jgi:hypothetical protein